MKYQHSAILRCPIDALPLHDNVQQLRCDNGHTFDIARQGYVNLLGAGDKRSRDPGDSKAMVTARREWFDGSHYEPVAARLTELLAPCLSDDAVIVDAGCGEGYFLAQLHNRLNSATGDKRTLIGFDISKWAVQAAARRLAATWLVASNRNIPLASDSADCVLSLFGFPVYESFSRVVRTGGLLVVAHAGPRHLIELREIIYPQVTQSDRDLVQGACASGFSPVTTAALQFTTAALAHQDITRLLTMTPHLYRASHDGKARAAQLDNFAVTVDIRFEIFQHTPPKSTTD
jgi:23S rRNA (guanine745-N1)-methyltransferase